MFTRIPKVSCSLLAALDSDTSLTDVLRTLSDLDVDMVHYDVSEMPKTLRVEDIGFLRGYTSLPFDVHLAVKNPKAYLHRLEMVPKDYFCLHVENNLSTKELETIKRDIGCHFGLAIRVETPVDTLYDSGSIPDYVLFMAATPGVSGGGFDERAVEKIRSFRCHFPAVKVHVDGGVNRLSAAILRGLGVDVVVSGSYILGSNESAKRVVNLLGRNLGLSVAAVMRCEPAMPVVRGTDTLDMVAREINNKRIGCVCVLDSEDHLLGLITDGDLRRCLMSDLNLSGKKAEQVMTKRPFTVTPDDRILDVLRQMEEGQLSFGVVPVVNNENHCKGVLWLQDILFSYIL